MVEIEHDGIVEPSEGAESILVSLGYAFKSTLRAFEREAGIGARKWYMLAMLAQEDGISQGEICQRFRVNPSRVTRVAKTLELEGLVRRERDPEDNRVVRLHLSEGGRELLQASRERRKRFDERIQSALGAEELEELKRTLGVLTEAMKDRP